MIKQITMGVEPYLCLLLAAVLRLWHLDYFSLWFDECLPLLVEPADLSARVFAGQFYLPVVYAVFAKYVLGVLGSDFFIRLPCAVFGVLSVGVARVLCSRLFGARAARFCAWAVALCPFYVYYSQDSRMYAIAGFLALCGAYCWLRAAREGKSIFHIGFVLCFAVDIYILNFTFLVYFPLVCMLAGTCLFKTRRSAFLFLSWQAVFAVLTLPFFLSILGVLSDVYARQGRFYNLTFAWIPQVQITDVFFSFKNFLFGFNAPAQGVGIVVLFCIFIAGYGVFAVRRRFDFETLACLLVVFFPLTLVFLVSRIYPCYQDKYFFAGSFFLWFLIARGLAVLSGQKAWWAFGLILLTLFASLGFYYRGVLPENPRQRRCVYARRDCTGALRSLENLVEPGELVYFSSNSVLPTFEFYTQRGDFARRLCSNLWLLDTKGEEGIKAYYYDTTYRQIWAASRKLQPGVQKSFWVVHSPWGNDSALEKDTPADRLIKKLKKQFRVTDVMQKKGMELLRFHA